MRRLAGAALLLLAALASAAFTVPAVAQMAPAHCDASDVNEVWCAVLTVGVSSSTNFRGFAGIDNFSYGALESNRFIYRGESISVLRLNEGRGSQGPPRLSFSISYSRDTQGGLLGSASFVLEIGTGAEKKSFAIDNPGDNNEFIFSTTTALPGR